MRAWLLDDTNGPSSYRLGEAPTPEPGQGQARVRVVTAGLNHLDIWVSLGLPKPRRFPHIAGADAAGVIDALGPGVSGWNVGDEVVVDPSISCGQCESCRRGETVFCRSYSILGEHLPGTLAEYAVVPVRNLRPKPTALSWESAGSFGMAAGTAYRMLTRARLRAGDVLLVVGVGGGVSGLAALIGKAMRAKVYVTSRSAAKLAWAAGHGWTGFDSAGEFSTELKAAAGRGADVVVDNAGAATWPQSLRSLEGGGRLAICGGTAGGKVELSLPYLFFKQIELIGSTMYTPAEFSRALHMVETGEVSVPIDSVHPFEDLPAALARLESGDQIGKVVIRTST